MRLERDEYFKQLAHLTAKRSTCLRRHVGCVIVKDNHVVSLGYNGAPPGQPHCNPDTCNEEHPCFNTVHAEVNAIRHARTYFCQDSIIYTTDEPCIHCARQLIVFGVAAVFYDRPYRKHDGLEEFKLHHVSVHRF